METKELERLVACAELRRPKVFNASRERYVIEISFKTGQKSGRKEVMELLEKEYPAIVTWQCWQELSREVRNA